VGETRSGPYREVSFDTQVFSMPAVTDKKTKTSHTTSATTVTDIKDINAVDSDFGFGSKYLRAMRSSNNFYFASLNATWRRSFLSNFFSSNLSVVFRLFLTVQ
jgi:hypothetical protein